MTLHTRILAQLQRFVVSRFWGQTFAEGGIRTWMHEPVARRYINLSVSGDPQIWPMEWFKVRVGGLAFPRALSLGCGDGALERDIRRKGLCEHVLGLDLSSQALELARAKAAQEGIGGIEYERADLNHLDLGGRCFDIAFVHQALHHVLDLEHCLAMVRGALKPGGLFYVDEYVGPSRKEWNRALLADAEEALVSLPATARRRRRLKPPVDWRDPSEAVRSGEILDVLGEHFSIVEQRDYGGNLFAQIHPHLKLDGLSESARDAILEELVEKERNLLATGVRSFYSVVIAT